MNKMIVAEKTDVIIVGSTAPDVLKLIAAVNKDGAQVFNIIGFLDDNPSRHDGVFFGHPVLGSTDLLGGKYAGVSVINNVGRTMASRSAVVQKLKRFNAVTFPSLIHPSVDTAYAEIGEGCMIQENVVLGPGCVIGPHCLIYAHAVVGHEAIIGDTTFIANNAVVGARSTIGSRVFIGLNSVIFPEQAVGADSTIGAGSIAMRSVAAGATVFGNPARQGVVPLRS